MTGKAFLCYGDEFSRYHFGPDHPFNPLRNEITIDLMQQMGLLSKGMLLKP